MDVGAPLVAHAQPPEAVEPGQGALDDPAVAARAARCCRCPSGRCAPGCGAGAGPAGSAGCRSPCRHGASPGACAAGPAGVLIGGMASSSPRRRQSWRLAPVRSVASGRPARSTTRWRFVPGLPRSVGFGPRRRPPFGRDAGPVQAGPAPVDAGPPRPAGPSRSRCRPPRRRPPASRAAVASRSSPEPQPISWGSISQGMPDFSTKMMPVKAARSGTRGRPPLGLGGSGGSSGATMAHRSSLTRGLAHAPSLPVNYRF